MSLNSKKHNFFFLNINLKHININKIINSKLFLHNVTSKNSSNLVNNFLIGKRKNIYIINIEQSIFFLKRALHFLNTINFKTNEILFLGIINKIDYITKLLAQKTKQSYINTIFKPGVLSNNKIIKNTFYKKLIVDIQKKKKLLASKKVLKKNLIMNWDSSLESKKYSFINYLPKVVFCIAFENTVFIEEIKKKNIPIIAILSPNQQIKNISFPIPSSLGQNTLLYLTNIIFYSFNKTKR